MRLKAIQSIRKPNILCGCHPRTETGTTMPILSKTHVFLLSGKQAPNQRKPRSRMNCHHVRNVKTCVFEIFRSPTAGKLALTAPNARKDARHRSTQAHTRPTQAHTRPTQAHTRPTQAHNRPTQAHNRFTSSHALGRRVPMPTCIPEVSQHLRQRRILGQFRKPIYQATYSKTQQPFLRRRQGRTCAGPGGPHL